MIGYYVTSPKGNKCFYIPQGLLVTDTHKGPRTRFKQNTLERISLAMINGSFARQDLERDGWSIFQVNVSDRDYRKFLELCEKCEEESGQSLYQAEKIFEKVENYIHSLKSGPIEEFADSVPISFNCNPDSSFQEPFPQEYPHDDEDYSDEWWKRGEKAPFLD